MTMFFNGNKIYISEKFYYTIFKIKDRIIFSPCDELKKEQQFFLNAIKWTYKLKQDTLQAARIHMGGKWILKIDIKNFYGSVPSNDIKLFIKKVCKRIKDADVNYFYNLVTINDKLPTGAPTSSHIANACFEKVEKDIRNICHLYNIEFSRYMDDLTLSADNKKILVFMEKRISNILNFYGYKINLRKIKYIPDNKQQVILGLVVNANRVRLAKSFKRNIRACLHSYAMFNYPCYDKDIKYRTWDNIEINRLKGYIAYIKHVDRKYYDTLKKYSKKLSNHYKIVIPFFK